MSTSSRTRVRRPARPGTARDEGRAARPDPGSTAAHTWEDSPREDGTVDIPLLAEALALVAGMALVARRTILPAPVILRVTSEFGWGPSLSLQPETILSAFLPPLLFEGAFRLDLRLLRQSLWPLLLLAVPGVLFSLAVVGTLIHVSLGLPWAAALLCGAVLAATDPVAVLALFRTVGGPAWLFTIVEGESLLNDGTALVLRGALLSVTSGQLSVNGFASVRAITRRSTIEPTIGHSSLPPVGYDHRAWL